MSLIDKNSCIEPWDRKEPIENWTSRMRKKVKARDACTLKGALDEGYDYRALFHRMHRWTSVVLLVSGGIGCWMVLPGNLFMQIVGVIMGGFGVAIVFPPAHFLYWSFMCWKFSKEMDLESPGDQAFLLKFAYRRSPALYKFLKRKFGIADSDHPYLDWEDFEDTGFVKRTSFL